MKPLMGFGDKNYTTIQGVEKQEIKHYWNTSNPSSPSCFWFNAYTGIQYGLPQCCLLLQLKFESSTLPVKTIKKTVYQFKSA